MVISYFLISSPLEKYFPLGYLIVEMVKPFLFVFSIDFIFTRGIRRVYRMQRFEMVKPSFFRDWGSNIFVESVAHRI